MDKKEMYQEIPLDMSLVVSKEKGYDWENKAIYYPKLENLIKTFGGWSINCNALARDWEVPKTTVYNWKKEIIDNLSIVDIKETMQDLNLTSLANIKFLHKLMRTTKDERVSVAAAKVIADLGKNYLELLDRMGLTNTETKRLTLAKAYEEYEKEHGN